MHGILAVANTAILVAAWYMGDRDSALDRVSLVSAYVFWFLISFVLLIGPARAIRTGRPTINHTLRRDVAIWSAVLGLVHLFAGAAQSMTPMYLDHYVAQSANGPSAATRETFFFWSTITGFIVGLMLILLLTLSSNWSMKLIGQRWWKRLHRISYVAFGLTLVHGLGFQVLESRSWTGYALVVATTLIVCIAQLRGLRAVSSRHTTDTD